VLKATIGTWLNYATTLGFQILFVARFGTAKEASAYVLVFALSIGVAGILITTVQTVAAGRLLSESGGVRVGAVRFLTLIVAAAATLGCGVALLAAPLGEAVAKETGYDVTAAVALLRLGGAMLFLQVLGGAVAVVALVKGYRFVPAAAPAMPTLAASIGLAVVPSISVVQVMGLFVGGSLLQCAAVAVAAVRNTRVVAGAISGATTATVLMIVSLSLLSLIAPIERTAAGIHGIRDIAVYDYGMRSLRAVQQLVAGGAILAILGDWSGWATGTRRRELSQGLVTCVALVSVGLALSASVAAVAGRQIIAITYQHGAFSASDTRAVLGVILFGLPGFCAEGLGLVFSYALAGARLNQLLAAIGIANFIARVALALILGGPFGAVGIAFGYSVVNVALLLPAAYLVARRLIDPTADLRMLRAVGVVAGGTVLSALVLATLAGGWSPLVNVAIVCAVCGLLMARFRPVPSFRSL
jgi:peptidoglycan biosynthesis protein MviN/MurJ (putative lipid II flippase)